MSTDGTVGARVDGMRTTRQTPKLGDTISGEYHGTAFSGVIVAWDGSGCAYVDLSVGIEVYSLRRASICLAPYQQEDIRIEALGYLRPEDICAAPPSAMGGTYIRSSRGAS